VNETTSEPGTPTIRFRTNRMEAFSDGVLAIAITLLVLEIAVPTATSANLLQAVVDAWPSYLAYFVSFATIGAVWLWHTVITEFLDHADSVFLRLNLLLLLVVAFLPFPTRLVAESLRSTDNERVAVTMYGVNLLLASVLLSVLWRYAASRHLIHPDASDEDVVLLSQRVTPGLGGYVVLIVIGLFAPTIAVFGYLALAAFIILPGRARRPSRAGGGGKPPS
jgi:uncharacterized membrane protein